MKKIGTWMMGAVLVLSLSACTAATPAATIAPTAQATAEATAAVQATGAQGDETPMADERLVVMDAALYRGEITEMIEDADKTILVLRQAPGTSFSAAELRVNMTADTRTNAKKEAIQVGVYVEIFYGGTLPEDAQVGVDAIALNVLGETGMRVYNGTVAEIIPDATDPNAGMMVMEPIGEGEAFRFTYGPDTQFYMNKDAFIVGAKLNILRSPESTRSIPAQSRALEVRPYAEK